jgi:hypothetical protein
MSERYHQRFLVAAGIAALLLSMIPGKADAQVFFNYTSDDLSGAIIDTLLLTDEAEETIDTDHKTFAKWFLCLAEKLSIGLKREMPDAAFQRSIYKAQACLKEGKTSKARAHLRKASNELARLAKFWDMQGAEARLAELVELLERGEIETCRSGVSELGASVRIDPLQKYLDDAADCLRRARERQGKGFGMDTIGLISKAQQALRRGYCAARLTQVKVIVIHARTFVTEGRHWMARVALWRASRKLGETVSLSTEAEADAIFKIQNDIKEVRAMVRERNPGAENKLQQIETKVDALMKKLGG